MTYDHKKAERALEKIARRQSGVSIQDALKPAEIELLIKRGHLYWHEYKLKDGGTDRFLALTEAGSDCMTYVRASLRWRRKWEIMRDRADRIWGWCEEANAKLGECLRQKQPSIKMTIGSIEYELEVTEN